MRETWVQSLGWEDPLEKTIATHSSSLAWRIPWISFKVIGFHFQSESDWNSMDFSFKVKATFTLILGT